jgi:SAM-dependent methyltransferase
MVDRGVASPSKEFDYDAELRRYQRRLREAIDVSPGDSVIDIGCGAGQTTREAARLAISALGVDTSPAMVARAQQLAAAEELHNVRFEQADAQVHPFPPETFTLGISRFGTMFFADPVEASPTSGARCGPGRGWCNWCGRTVTVRSGWPRYKAPSRVMARGRSPPPTRSRCPIRRWWTAY